MNILPLDTDIIKAPQLSVRELIAMGKHPHVKCLGKLVKLSISDAARVCKDMEIVWC